MDHAVTVRAQQDQVGELGPGFTAGVERHAMVTLNVVRTVITICLGEVEPTRLAPDTAVLPADCLNLPGTYLRVTLARDVTTFREPGPEVGASGLQGVYVEPLE